MYKIGGVCPLAWLKPAVVWALTSHTTSTVKVPLRPTSHVSAPRRADRLHTSLNAATPATRCGSFGCTAPRKTLLCVPPWCSCLGEGEEASSLLPPPPPPGATTHQRTLECCRIVPRSIPRCLPQRRSSAGRVGGLIERVPLALEPLPGPSHQDTHTPDPACALALPVPAVVAARAD